MKPNESMQLPLSLIATEVELADTIIQQDAVSEWHGADHTLSDNGEKRNFSEKILHSKTGRALTAFVTAAGFGVAGELAMANDSSASMAPAPITHAMKPSHAMRQIYYYFIGAYDGLTATINATSDTVRPHQLIMKGVCNPHTPWYPSAKDISDTSTTLTTTDCARNLIDGRYQTRQTPHNQLPYANERHVTYVPLLGKLGEAAATSVGIADTMHGDARYIHASPKELDIVFNKNSTGTSSATKQLKKLKLVVRGGSESIQKTWYTK